MAGETGPDLEYCAELENTTTEEIIRKHSQHEYYVYMLGFARDIRIWPDLMSRSALREELLRE